MKERHFNSFPRQISFDARSLSIDGKRRLLISGEIHYARMPRSEWGRVLDQTAQAGWRADGEIEVSAKAAPCVARSSGSLARREMSHGKSAG